MKAGTLIAVLVVFAFGLAISTTVDAKNGEGQVQKQEKERNNWCVRNQVRIEAEAQGDPDTCVKLKLRNHERKGARLKVNAKGLEPNAECEFRVIDPDTGEVLASEQVKTNKRGRLRIKARSRDGDGLFCGEDNAEGLTRCRFEICYRNGDVAAEGDMPAP